MPKLPVATGAEVVRALRRAGFVVDRQSGSHKILKDHARGLTLSVPEHGSRPLKSGTLRGIIRDAGLTVEAFVRLLK